MITGNEYVDIIDPTDANTVYRFDSTFFLSPYRCTWGNGCKGTKGEPDHGCCADGVYMYEEEKDRLVRFLDQHELTDWQHEKDAQREGWLLTVEPEEDADEDEPQEWKTNVFDGHCVFSGDGDCAGCALYRTTSELGVPDVRPIACITYPIRIVSEVEDGDKTIYTIGPARRPHDGALVRDGDWWCIDDHANYTAGKVPQPALFNMRENITVLTNRHVYDLLVEWASNKLIHMTWNAGHGQPTMHDDGRHATVPVTFLTRPPRVDSHDAGEEVVNMATAEAEVKRLVIRKGK